MSKYTHRTQQHGQEPDMHETRKLPDALRSTFKVGASISSLGVLRHTCTMFTLQNLKQSKTMTAGQNWDICEEKETLDLQPRPRDKNLLWIHWTLPASDTVAPLPVFSARSLNRLSQERKWNPPSPHWSISSVPLLTEMGGSVLSRGSGMLGSCCSGEHLLACFQSAHIGWTGDEAHEGFQQDAAGVAVFSALWTLTQGHEGHGGPQRPSASFWCRRNDLFVYVTSQAKILQDCVCIQICSSTTRNHKHISIQTIHSKAQVSEPEMKL